MPSNPVSRLRAATVLASVVALFLPAAVRAATPSAFHLHEDGEATIVEFELGQWENRAISIDGGIYHCPVLAGEAEILVAGAPGLPTVRRSLIIPPDAKMAIEVMETAFYEYHARVAPSKGSLKRTVDPSEVPYCFGPTYRQDAWYPGAVADLGRPYILRDFRGAVLKINPFQYNPVTNTVRVYTRVKVKVCGQGPGACNILPRGRTLKGGFRDFQTIYSNHFLNYDPKTLYDPIDETGEMLVICHDPWMAQMEPLVAYKNSIGIKTTVVAVSTVGNDSASIKAYIQNVYDSSDLVYVLLVGDAEQVASRPYTAGGETSTADPAYALLEGDDFYPDIMVGRFSAETEQQVRTQVERTLAYEQMPATGQDWFWKGTGIASDQGPGDDGEMDNEHIENIKTLLLLSGYTEVDGFYDPDAKALEMGQALDAGRGVVNYCGHGGSGGWGTGGFVINHVESLVNHEMLPFIVSVACSTGHFQDTTCLGEAFLRAVHGGVPTGAVGFYGGSVSQYWSEPMEAQDEFNLLLTAGGYAGFGALCFAGSCSMMDKYGSGGEDMFITWHVFGDPSVRVTGTAPAPTGLGVYPFTGLYGEGPKAGPFTPEQITFTLHNHETAPLVFAVTVDKAWLDLSVTGGTLPPGGEMPVTVSLNDLSSHLGKGRHEAVIDLRNTTGTGGDTVRMVLLDVGVPEPVYVFDLETDPGWRTAGEWAFGQPTGHGGVTYGYPDPTCGATGDYVYGVNLDGDYSVAEGGPYHLTTDAIDCSGLRKVSLRFKRWLNSDFQPYFFSTVEVSVNKVDWETVWENNGAEIAEHAWSDQVYDLSSFADGKATVYIRWGYEKGNPAYPYSGWNIDDIEIWGIEKDGALMEPEPVGDWKAKP